jgi:hypothetical protein
VKRSRPTIKAFQGPQTSFSAHSAWRCLCTAATGIDTIYAGAQGCPEFGLLAGIGASVDRSNTTNESRGSCSLEAGGISLHGNATSIATSTRSPIAYLTI